MQNAEANADGVASPKSYGVFDVVYASLLIAANLFVLFAAWCDQSWGALFMAFVGSPFLNVLFVTFGLAAIPILQERRGQLHPGRHLLLTLVLPMAAAMANLLIILSMDLHGC